MSNKIKSVDSLTISDFQFHPVWEFLNQDELGEMAMAPVDRIPVNSLDSRLVGTQVVLANGEKIWATLGNVDTTNRRATAHFLCMSLERNGKWFNLARYQDVDYPRNGPDGLATFLGLKKADIFPISYDIRKYASGVAEILKGSIPAEPGEILSQQELIDLALRRGGCEVPGAS